MTFLEMEMKELGISDYNNTHNKRSLIRTLKYVPDIVADGKSINTHTHTHTHTHAHARTHTHKVRGLKALSFKIAPSKNTLESAKTEQC